MPPMTSQETSSYIIHHLKLAGRSDPLFSDDAASLVHTTSRGYPRAVNNLAIPAPIATYAAGKNIVDHAAARAAITEVIRQLTGTSPTDAGTTTTKSPAVARAAGAFRIPTSAS